ncbi:MAG: sigma-54 dependent transcriptional regulator [Candidatus Zixiibacteriota bacterium]
MNQPAKILIISSDGQLQQGIGKALSDINARTITALTSRDGLKKIREERCDMVIADSRLEDFSCPVLIRKIMAKTPDADVLVGLPTEDLHRQNELLDCGADDVFEIPFKPEEVHLKVSRLLKEKSFLESCGLVGKSIQLKQIAESALQVAPTNITVLITGESGTGKELVARAIHANSLRKDKPFVAANVGALAEGVVESELFGHEKGAFTGAVSRRQGLFETADGGTIFLDEIGEFKPSTQVKLLRVLEERSFMRVGGSSDIKVDVRVIAATNQNLERKMREGTFRSDLYFRLAVVRIDVPPLRERPRDIPILIHSFIERLNEESPRRISGITDEALELLTRYYWPGNVRELKNFLESMLALAPGRRIEASDVEKYVDIQAGANRRLPVVTGKSVETAEHELLLQAILSLRAEIISLKESLLGSRELRPEKRIESEGTFWVDHGKTGQIPGDFSVEEMEKGLIQKALAYTRGNRKKTAQLLGMGERTLYRKLDKYKLR